MKMFIPACGFQIRLSEDWRFNLYIEHRNKKLLETLGFGYSKFSYWRPGQRDDINEENSKYVEDSTCANGFRLKSFGVVIPKDSDLEVYRVYIRANSKSAKSNEDDYDSITFRVVSSSQKNLSKTTFWAKLSEVNEISFEEDKGLVSSKEELREKMGQKVVKLTAKKIEKKLIEVENWRTNFWNPAPEFKHLKTDIVDFGNEFRRLYHPQFETRDHGLVRGIFLPYAAKTKFKRHSTFNLRTYEPQRFSSGYHGKIEYYAMEEYRLIVLTNSEDKEILDVRLVKLGEIAEILASWE